MMMMLMIGTEERMRTEAWTRMGRIGANECGLKKNDREIIICVKKPL